VSQRYGPVRATAAFFEDVDRQLPAERGPAASHRRTTSGLRALADRRAPRNRFDDLPRLIPNREDYRILIIAGVLVRHSPSSASSRRTASSNSSELDIDLETP
jgi:hypothetical protein